MTHVGRVAAGSRGGQRRPMSMHPLRTAVLPIAVLSGLHRRAAGHLDDLQRSSQTWAPGRGSCAGLGEGIRLPPRACLVSEHVTTQSRCLP